MGSPASDVTSWGNDCAAVLLCAGVGSRLGALTAQTPKPLLEVAGEPIASHALRLLARHGFSRVFINLHFGGDLIRETLGDGSRYGVAIEYLEEPELSGTGGPLVQLRERLASASDVLVLYGDLVLDEDLTQMLSFHRQASADVTLLVHERAGSNSVLELATDSRVVNFLERPSAEERRGIESAWVNSGVQFLNRPARAALPDRVPCDLPRDLYVPNVETLRIMTYRLSGYRVAVDSPERLKLARETWPKHTV